jgi:3-keto-5-aminohexanoate cleavage enzyme
MASLDMGPLNRYRHLTSENTRHTIDELAREMADRGIKPELELFNNGHIGETRRLLADHPELLADPLYATLIVGPGTLSPPDPRTFLTLVEALPEGAMFNTLGFGRHQLPFAALGVLLGGQVRVGLEDNVYYRRGELADSNAQLVERAAGLARTLGREPATPDQARSILGL